MKGKQLLSIVFSVIMFTGVSAGSMAFAESDEYYDTLEDNLEDFCYMNENEQRDFFSNYPDMAEYDEKLAIICEIENEDERINSIYDFIDAVIPVTRNVDDIDDNTNEDYDRDVDADFRDKLARWCEMSDEDKRITAAEYDKTEDQIAKADRYCTLNETDRTDFIAKHRDEFKDHMKDRMTDKMYDKYSNKGPGNLRDHFAMFCDMTPEERAEKMDVKHDNLPDDLRADMARYCEMTDDEQNDFRDIMMDRMDELHDSMKDRMNDTDMREMVDRYCEMSDEDKRAFVAEHDKAAEHVEKMNKYCSLDGDAREDFIKDQMKDKMRDNMSDKRPHMNYDRLCDMAVSDRALEITDSAKLDRISEWCEMTPEERKDFKQDHKGDMKDRMTDKVSDKRPHMNYDRLCDLSESDRALKITDVEKLDRISKWCEMTPEERQDYKRDNKDEMKDRMMDRISDISPRLQGMIMNKHDITDERMDEIKMKFKEKHGDLTDEKRSELKMKFKDHMKKIRINLTDEQKSDIHDRIAEMKAFKADLRERASDMTDEEKQELRAEFIEKAKDMRHAWISPRTQMTAGLDAADVECREGYSLVMKASSGVAMCLYSDTALKMIDRGIVVPAN